MLQKCKCSKFISKRRINSLMAQSQCRRSVGDQFWPEVVVENKESLNNRRNYLNKSGAVTLSPIFSRILTRLYTQRFNTQCAIRWRRSQKACESSQGVSDSFAGDYSQILNLNLNFQSHKNSCDQSHIIRRTPPINRRASWVIEDCVWDTQIG